jgi:hypothetical protein
VAAAVVVGLAAALIWMLATGDGGDGDAAAASSTSSPAGVTTGPTGEAATPPTADEAAGATTVANGETSSTPTAAATVDSLSTVLLGADDLDGPVITLEERTVDSGDDPDHPLASYDYCDTPPDLSEVGAGAIRVLTNDILAADAIVVSSASLASSADAAESVVDELVAVADRCDQFTDGLAQVTVLGATRTAERGEVGLLVASSGLTADVELTVVSIAVGEVIVTLEVSAPAAERERLLALLVERAGALTS